VIFLETDRLCLRNVAPKDAAVMYDYRNNPACARFQRGQTKDLSGIEKMVADHQADVLTTEHNCLIAVADKKTDALIGEIIVMPNDDCFSLGYTFHYAHHRQGFAFEALSALIDILHSGYPDWEFISFTDKDNMPSMNLLKKLGYTDMGYIEKLDSQIFGKWVK
jgi:RimJ/RimL family protein N-acetyltransferase